MNAEDQTTMLGLALQDEFGKGAVAYGVDFDADPTVGSIRIEDTDVSRIESILQSHVDSEAEKNDIDFRFTVEVNETYVRISDIHPVPLTE